MSTLVIAINELAHVFTAPCRLVQQFTTTTTTTWATLNPTPACFPASLCTMSESQTSKAEGAAELLLK
jgi:hypothetical protein